jgi:hypothetical protein
MIWNYLKAKEKMTDDTLQGLKAALEKNSDLLAKSNQEISKLKIDLNRCFFAIKHVAGPEWDKISERIRNDS